MRCVPFAFAAAVTLTTYAGVGYTRNTPFSRYLHRKLSCGILGLQQLETERGQENLRRSTSAPIGRFVSEPENVRGFDQRGCCRCALPVCFKLQLTIVNLILANTHIRRSEVTLHFAPARGDVGWLECGRECPPSCSFPQVPLLLGDLWQLRSPPRLDW